MRSLSFGAGDEARTRYLHLGKVALYRMSYTRNEQDVLYHLILNCQVFFPELFRQIFVPRGIRGGIGRVIPDIAVHLIIG